MTIKDIIKIIKADGWYEINQRGSHIQYKHPTKKENYHARKNLFCNI